MAELLSLYWLRVYRRLDPVQRESIRRLRLINRGLESSGPQPQAVDIPLHFPTTLRLDTAE